MKRKILSVLGIVALLSSLIAALPASAGQGDQVDLPIAVDGTHFLLHDPEAVSPADADAAVAAASTSAAQCFGDDTTRVVTLYSFDPEHYGSQDVVFFKETANDATGLATLWVAWDFLTTDFGRTDVITCDQLAYLQGAMDGIVETDVEYFGQYVERPAGDPTLDVMIYNIVDESYFDPTYASYIVGFFSSSTSEQFNRNIFFIDSLDWANRLGSDVARPYVYEGTVAHELEHLIHNDVDGNEESWVDEGLADLAEYFNGFPHPDSHVVYYLAYHRTPLTVWGGGLESYGASYLFQLYLLENFGTKTDGVWEPGWTLNLVAQAADGIPGIEAQTGAKFNDLYDAWILANYLDKPTLDSPAGFPLGYDEIDLAPFVAPRYTPWSIARSITDIYGSDHHGNLPVSRYWGGYKSGTVEYPIGALAPYAPLYGTYKGMEPLMNINLRGDAKSGVTPHAGLYEVASGGGNMVSDRMLALIAPVGGELRFWTWYDIEEEWDYGFVEVSTDGSTWAPLPGSITTASNNPNGSTAWGNSLLGSAASSDAVITGNSGGWVEGVFQLPAGNVWVRFSYYTDEATNGQGWFIDDVSVGGATYDFETGAAGWNLGGWQRTTGLFDNDWMAAYVDPVYKNGKFVKLDYGYLEGDNRVSPYEYVVGAVDTSRLNRQAATVVISNRPGASPFDAGYRLLVSKGSAK